MNINKYFDDAFNTRCLLTNHSLKRLNSRFLGSEITQLKFLVQAAIKNTPLEQWKTDETTVLIDPKLNFSIICAYYQDEKVLKVISFIRGKTEEAYKDCKTISVSISKEKAEQEVLALSNKKPKF